MEKLIKVFNGKNGSSLSVSYDKTLIQCAKEGYQTLPVITMSTINEDGDKQEVHMSIDGALQLQKALNVALESVLPKQSMEEIKKVKSLAELEDK